MTSKLFAFAALVFLLAGCSGESQFSQDGTCEEDGDCPSGFTCEKGLCEGASSATTDAGTGSIGDGGVTVSAAGEVEGGPGAVVEVETEDCLGPRCDLKPGTSVTFRARPVDGYRFTGWTGMGCPVSSAWEIVVEDVKVDTVCTANYVKLVTVTGGSSVANVDITASTKAEPATCAGPSCVVDEGSIVLLTASELSGYRFAGFIEPECTDVEGLTVFVKAGLDDVTCTASYVRTFEVGATSVGVNAPIGVQSDTAFASCMDGRCVIDEQGEVRLSAPTLDGYRFVGWTGGGPCIGSAPVLDIMPVTESLSCAANYVKRFTATGLAAGSPSNPAPLATSTADFSQCDAGVCVVDEGSDVVLSARTVPGYRLTGFTGAGCDDVSGTAVTLSDLAANIECTAQYVQGISIAGNVVGASGEVIASSSSPGSNCAAGGCVVDAGGNVLLTAPSLSGFRFTGWTGDAGCSGTTQSITLSNVSVSATCSANFVARRDVRFADPVGGSIVASNIPAFASCDGDNCIVDNGGALTLTAVADGGYRFNGWTGCSVSSQLQLSLQNIVADQTCSASFVRQWNVSYAAGAGGSVSSPAAQCAAGSPCTVDDGTNLTITATPAAGYRLVGWTGAGCVDSVPATVNVVDLSAIHNSVTCNASFVRQWSVSYAAGTGGSVSAQAPQCASGSPCTVDQGASLSVTATPAAGYRFGGWSGTACNDSVSGTVNVVDLSNIGANVVCNASFVSQWTVSYAAGTGGSVNAPAGLCPAGSPCTVDQGANLAITAAPASGYRFNGWTGTGCTDGNGTTAEVVELLNIGSAVTCSASFTRQWSVSYAAGTGGSVSAPAGVCPAGSPCTVDQGANLAITATPASGYRFNGWAGAGCTDSAPGTVNVVDLSGISSVVTCSASFTRQWSVTYSASAGGAVTAPAAQCPAGSPCTLDAGADLDLTATAAAGYRFGSWSGTGCTDSTPGTVNVLDLAGINASVTCTASFVLQGAVSYSAGPGGTVSAPAAQCPSGSPCTLDDGANLSITASASAGYRFGNWSGAGCTDSNPNTPLVVDLTNITTGVSCVATFVRQWAVTYATNAGGSVSAPSAQCAAGSPCTVDQGANLALTATPAAGYRFGSWAGAGCTDSAAGTVNVVDLSNISSAVTCTASFVRQWAVTYAANTGGNVNAPNAQCPAGSPCTVDQGANLALTATPAAGYRFGSWSGAGCTDSAAGTVNVVDLANIGSAVTCTASFVRQWAVTYSAGSGGNVTAPSGACPSGSPCTVDQGANLAITASPSAGYRFDSWSGTACTDTVAGTANVADLGNISAAVTCTASFVLQGAVTYSAGTGGSVSAPAGQCPAGSPCTVDQGSNLSITATPSAGYRFGNWSGTGCTDSNASTPFVVDLSNITTGITCTANFVRQWSVTYAANTGGSVSAPAGQCASGSPCTLDQGSNLNVTAAPAAGYRFDAWTGAGCTDADSTTLQIANLTNISSAITCTASFVRQWAVTYSASAGGTISAPSTQCVSGSPCTVGQGADLDLTAAAASGFRFNGWTGTGCIDSVAGTPEVADLVGINSAITCVASFTRQWSVSYAASAGGSVSAPVAQCPAGSPCTVDQGTNLAITAAPASGYRFSGWTGTNCTDSVAGTVNVVDLASIGAAVTCTASFVRQWAVTYAAGAGGSVSAPAAQCPAGSPCTVDQGASLDITALPASGYRFNGWTGTNCNDSVAGTPDVADLVGISSAVTCTASFAPQWTVTYAAGAGGSVSAPAAQCPAGSPCNLDQGANLAVTAAPAAGYRFGGWSGTGCSDSAAGTVNIVDLSNISSAITCTASFVRQWAVTYSASAGGTISAPNTQCVSGSPCTVDQGTDLDLTAAAASGFRFNGWTGTGCTDSVAGTPEVADLVGINSAITCVASFTRQWSVSYAANAGGSVSAPVAQCPAGSPCTVDQGTNLAITAAPASGYRFSGWTGTNCTDSAAGTVNVVDLASIGAAVTCTASFVRQWAVTYAAAAGGSVSAPAAQCPAGSPCTVDQGASLDVTALPASGYRFNGWTGANCNDSVAGTPDVADLVGISSAVTCTASFVQRWTIAAVVNAGGGGSVSATPSGQPACSGASCSVDQDTQVTLLATPSSTAYRFINWTGTNPACAGANASLTLQNVNATCTANFTQRWTIAAVVGPVAGGSVSATPSGQPACSGASCTVDQNIQVTLLAAPSSGAYRFVNWTGANAACASSTPSLTLQNVNATCTANFIQRWTIAAVVGPVAGGTVSATPNGQAACSGASCTVDQGLQVALLATPTSTAYRFVNWTGANAACTGTSATLTLQNVNATCTANFIQRWNIAAVVSTAGNGSVSATPNGQPACTGAACTVDQNIQVALVATPASAAYRFLNWTGANAACTGTNATLTLQNVNATCTANFTQRWRIAFPDPAVGSITPSNYAPSSACTAGYCDVDTGTAIQLTAAADDLNAYRFVSWSGCSTSTDPVLNLANISANATCTANFVRQWTVTFTNEPTGGTVSSSGAYCVDTGSNNCRLFVDQGANVDLTATALTGYRFGGWTCTDADTSTVNVLDLNAISADLTCNATFVRQWTVTYSSTVTGGTVSSAPAATCTGTGANNCVITVDQGTNVDLTAATGTGYRFGSWTCTDADTSTLTVLDLNGVASAYTCNATFVRQYRVQGSVTGAPLSNTVIITPCNNNDCTVDAGANVTLTAPVIAGFSFGSWTGAGCSDANPDNNPRTLQFPSLNANLQCSAGYTLQRFTIAVARVPDTLGQAQVQTPTSGNPVCTGIGGINVSCVVDSGTPVTITASVAGQNNTRFVRWSGGAGCATASLSQSLTASSNTTCNAEFYGLWSRTYRGADTTGIDQGYGALLDPKGEVLVSGTMSPSTRRAWLGQLDEHSGAVLEHGGYTDGSSGVEGFGIATDNKGYVVTASTYAARYARPLMLGFDEGRNLQWAREIQTADASFNYLRRAVFYPRVVSAAGDASPGYVAVGVIASTPSYGHLAAVSSEAGKVLFNRRFCMADTRTCSQTPACFSTQAVDVVRTESGFAVASQVLTNTNAYYSMLTFFDASGKTLEEYYYRRPADGEISHDLIVESMLGTRDGGFLMVGRTRNLAAASQPDDDGFAMLLDSRGAIKWQRRIGNVSTNERFTRATVALDEREYVLTGYAAGGSQTSDGWLVRLRVEDGSIFPQDNPDTRPNENGNILYHVGSGEELFDIVANLDGGYTMTGARRSDPKTGDDVWAMRVDNEGMISFISATVGTRTVARHTEGALAAIGPIKVDCIFNEERMTEGSDMIEPFRNSSTPFAVGNELQTP